MEQLLEWMEIIEDVRQHRKVRHSIKDILIIVLFATLANADTWEQIADFALWNEEYLRQYIELKNGIPSHDTIQRVMGMARPENLQQLQRKWQELLDSNEGEKLKKIICVDGKTMRPNKREGTKPCHIVSAWRREDRYCLGQKAVEEKNNGITAVPKVLESIEIKGQVVTIDAMGTQTAIVETIRKRRADYVLAVKGNQGNLEMDIRQYFEGQRLCEEIKKGTGCKKTKEKAHGQIESMHWHLDVTFREDANTTLDKIAAQNQNIIRKWCLSMLKLIEIRGTKMSLRRKRFNISFAPAQFIEELMKI